MLTHLDLASSLAIALFFSFVLVVAFEASNGFHDTANAVATVMYTKSLPPVPAVLVGAEFSKLYRIATAWLLSLPITILIAGAVCYVLAAPTL